MLMVSSPIIRYQIINLNNNYFIIQFSISEFGRKMTTTTKMVRKFSFKDVSLAFRVRQKVRNALVQFDENQNQLFQSDEIRKALMSILNEDQMEVQYVVNNVFRYDTDGDNAITYTEFTNFCVEQHFGEMAIQRLHRMGYYQNGAKRVMSLPQFEATLNYCLETINSKGNHNQYAQLFKEVDIDHDSLISYQDYFIFLRQYFGSQSEAFEQQKKNPTPIPVRTSTKPSDGQQRFCRLIYSQFKISVMQRDKNRNLTLERQQIQQILSNNLRLSYQQAVKLREKCMDGQNTIQYDKFIKTVLVQYMSDLGFHKVYGQKFGQSEFVDFVGKICHFVQVKPSQDVIRICFRDASRGEPTLSFENYCSFMRNMLRNYRFDTRGLPSSHSYHVVRKA